MHCSPVCYYSRWARKTSIGGWKYLCHYFGSNFEFYLSTYCWMSPKSLLYMNLEQLWGYYLYLLITIRSYHYEPLYRKAFLWWVVATELFQVLWILLFVVYCLFRSATADQRRGSPYQSSICYWLFSEARRRWETRGTPLKTLGTIRSYPQKRNKPWINNCAEQLWSLAGVKKRSSCGSQ